MQKFWRAIGLLFVLGISGIFIFGLIGGIHDAATGRSAKLREHEAAAHSRQATTLIVSQIIPLASRAASLPFDSHQPPAIAYPCFRCELLSTSGSISNLRFQRSRIDDSISIAKSDFPTSITAARSLVVISREAKVQEQAHYQQSLGSVGTNAQTHNLRCVVFNLAQQRVTAAESFNPSPLPESASYSNGEDAQQAILSQVEGRQCERAYTWLGKLPAE